MLRGYELPGGSGVCDRQPSIRQFWSVIHQAKQTLQLAYSLHRSSRHELGFDILPQITLSSGQPIGLLFAHDGLVKLSTANPADSELGTQSDWFDRPVHPNHDIYCHWVGLMVLCTLTVPLYSASAVSFEHCDDSSF